MFSGLKNAFVTLLLTFFLVPSFVFASTFERPLSLGMSGSDVSALQTFLKEKGFYTYPEITGYFGNVTKDALAKYQASVGLEAVGQVGPKTLALLNGGVVSAPSSTLSSLITALQQLLRNAGYFMVPLSGVLDQATIEAAQSVSSGSSSAPQRSGGKPQHSDDEDAEDDVVADITAPVLSSIASSPSQTSATITWTTNEAATSVVNYGLTSSYGSASSSAALSTGHTINLSGLTASTTYHFQVRSVDASSNIATSSDLVLTTAAPADVIPPVLSAIASSTATSTATITWTTNEVSDSRVDYGTTASYGSASTSAAFVTSHSVMLTGLTASTTYHFRVQSTDASSNIATSSDLTFTIGYLGILNQLSATSTAAWSSARRLTSGFAGSPAVTSGGNLVSLADQIGSRTAVASGTPAIDTNGINDRQIVMLDGVNDSLDFSLMALTGDFTIAVAMGLTDFTASSKALIGRQGFSSPYIRITSPNTILFKSDSATLVTLTMTNPLQKGFHDIRFVRSGSSITTYVDGENVGTVTNVTGTFTIDRIGKNQTAQWYKGGIGEMIIFESALSSQDGDLLDADMQAAWRSTMYIDPDNGNDSNTGWNTASPFKTFAEVRDGTIRPGAQIRIKRGTTARRDPIFLGLTSQTGSATRPIVFDTYGTGDAPIFIGSEQMSGSGWTSVTGTEHKKATTSSMTTRIEGVYYVVGSTITRLVQGTSGALANGEWAVAAQELHVNVGGDPSGGVFEVSYQGAIADPSAVRITRDYVTVRNLTLRYWAYDGLRPTGNYTRSEDIDAGWNVNDGYGPGGGSNHYVLRVNSHHNGSGISLLGSPGDGYSFHGGSSGIIEDSIAAYNDKAGFDHEQGTSVQHIGCIADGNYQNLMILDQAGGTGSWTFVGCTVTRRAGDVPEAVKLLSSTPGNITISNTTITDAEASATSKGLYSPGTATMSATLSNVTFTGFHQNIDWNSSGTLTQ
jgi:hypothetical protein